MAVTSTTITNVSGSLNFASSGTKVLTLHNIQSESIRKSAGLIDFPMPTLDSDGKIVMDLMGTSREIQIEGLVTINDADVGAGNLYKKARDIIGLNSSGNNTLVNGSQGTNQYTYASMLTQETAIKTVVSDSSATFEAGNPNSFKFSITLMEFNILI